MTAGDRTHSAIAYIKGSMAKTMPALILDVNSDIKLYLSKHLLLSQGICNLGLTSRNLAKELQMNGNR